MILTTFQLYAVTVLPAILILFGYYLFALRGKKVKVSSLKKEANEEGESTLEPAPALILDNVNLTWGVRIVDGNILQKIKEAHNTLGRKWDWKGQQIYAFEKSNDNYMPVYKTIPDLTHQPTALGRKLSQWATAGTFKARREKSNFAKWGWLFIFAGVIAFLMFLMVKG